MHSGPGLNIIKGLDNNFNIIYVQLIMKTKMLLIFWLTILAAVSSKAQTYAHQTLTRIETHQFPIQSAAQGYFYLPMNFNSAESKKILNDIPLDDIISVSLIYSQYRQSERFDQLGLNQSRTMELFEQMPGLKSKKDIEWYWVAQTGCQSPEECSGFFHGFEIKIKTEKDKEMSVLSNGLLDFYFLQSLYPDSTLLTTSLDSMASSTSVGISKRCDTTYVEDYNSPNSIGRFVIPGRAHRSFLITLNKITSKSVQSISWELDPRRHVSSLEGISEKQQPLFVSALLKHGYYKKSRFEGRLVSTSFLMNLQRNSKGKIIGYTIIGEPVDADGNRIKIEKTDISYTRRINCSYSDLSGNFVHEKVVTEVLNRNSHWKNCLVVTDVTGSMSPYLGQFLAWHFLNFADKPTHQHFVFFNDGDLKSDGLKRIGHTGGIYSIQTTSFENLKQTVQTAQSRGGGGDLPENNLEAVISGLEEHPELKEVIMIADNYATPRDMALISKIDRPIHFILCGTGGGINAAYLELARKNGGTVHTIESDILRLSQYKEGETFKIGNNTFKIANGHVVSVKS